MQENDSVDQEVDAGKTEPVTKNETSDRRGEGGVFLALTDLVADGGVSADEFGQLAGLLRNLTRCDLVTMSFYDPAQRRLVTHVWKKGEKTGERADLPPDVGNSPCGWVWHNQEVLTIPDLEMESRFEPVRAKLLDIGIHSCDVLPISTRKRRYGTLGLGRNIAEQDASDLALAGRAARLVALGVENQEIYQEWQKQRNRLQGLVEISRELNSTLEPEKAIPRVLSRIRRITNWDYARLALLEADGRTLRIRIAVFAEGAEAQLTEGPRIALGNSLSARAIDRRQVIFFNKEELQNHAGVGPEELRDPAIESLVSAPLVVGGVVLGTLDVGAYRESAFRAEDGEYLHQLAIQLAMAIHNADAYHEVKHIKDQLAQEKRYLESEIREERRLDEVVGRSAALKRVLEQAEVVARTEATVLISGETGTGKERIARMIHQMSTRRDRNFIKLNCAAIPTGLLESELFGHEKGAFTGAVSQKVGRLELADKGTLLLDEIGEISRELQPKLLRVLQDQEFERLGGTRTIRVDVRLIAASNRDLAKAVEEKEFRDDLFYRLHVFPIHMPALRERREDIPLLIRYFVDRCAARMNRKIEFIPDEAVEEMMNWHWPGNIRELENFIERSVILSEGNRLRAPLGELRREPGKGKTESSGTLRAREREHILEVLRQTGGVLSGPSGAAARLGLKRTTLQYKMQKLGISRAEYLG